MSYLTYLKTMLVEAVRETFNETYPIEEFRDLHASIEYPAEPANYPGIWVDYEDVDKLKIAGIDHKEYTAETPEGYIGEFTRWRFSGYVSYTIAALSSWERDRLFDELVKVFAFGKEHPARARFRQYIEANDFIAANFDFDEIEPRGNVAAPGTPWGTDEMIYERTVNMEVIGEFIADNATGDLLPLSRIIISAGVALGPDENPTSVIVPDGLATDWH